METKTKRTHHHNLSKGDKIKWRGRIGVLLTEPVYRTGYGGYGSSWGLHFAKVKWNNGEVREFMVDRTDIEKVK